MKQETKDKLSYFKRKIAETFTGKKSGYCKNENNPEPSDQVIFYVPNYKYLNKKRRVITKYKIKH